MYFSAFTHASFIGLQERFLAYARNDDTGKGYPQKFESRDEGFVAPAYFSYRTLFPTERGQGDRETNDTAVSSLI